MAPTETKTNPPRPPSDAVAKPVEKAPAKEAWRGFNPGRWQREIDTRDFIVGNVTPYTGGPEFLALPTKRTLALWERLQPRAARGNQERRARCR
jgi:pyruvate-formate lyase